MPRYQETKRPRLSRNTLEAYLFTRCEELGLNRGACTDLIVSELESLAEQFGLPVPQKAKGTGREQEL